jgi:hypothetical protein
MSNAKPLLIASANALVFCAFTIGCLPGTDTDRLNKIMDAGRSNVVTSIAIAREFRSVFTNCQVSIADPVACRPSFRNVQLKADLFDRYLVCLDLQVEFVSWKRLEVLSYNVNGLYLSEVTSISTQDGRTAYHFGDLLTLSQPQWQTLMTNGFRFDLIGIAVKTNQRVEGFRLESAVRSSSL